MKTFILVVLIVTGSASVYTFSDTSSGETMALIENAFISIKTKVLGEAASPPVRKASPAEFQASKSLAESLKGELVFDSNRQGNFGIYALPVGGGETVRKIADSSKQEIYPDVSLDGKAIVFARANDLGRDADSEIILVDRNGGNERRLAAGTFPTFSADGKKVYFEVKRSRVMSVGVDGTGETLLFPKPGSPFQGKKIVKPRVSASGEKLLFTSDHGGRWTAWSVNLLSGASEKVGKGCEPTHFNKTDSIAWITKKNVLAKSAIGRFDSKTGNRSILHDDGAPFGHEYFPTLEAEDRFLLYSACPAGQHSHYEANYQIFVRDIKEGKTVRVTFDQFTNRWPKFLPAMLDS